MHIILVVLFSHCSGTIVIPVRAPSYTCLPHVPPKDLWSMDKSTQSLCPSLEQTPASTFLCHSVPVRKILLLQISGPEFAVLINASERRFCRRSTSWCMIFTSFRKPGWQKTKMLSVRGPQFIFCSDEYNNKVKFLQFWQTVYLHFSYALQMKKRIPGLQAC